jgi:hypothetical protein
METLSKVQNHLETPNTLLDACIKAEGCSGGTIHQFLPFVSTELRRLGKIYNVSNNPKLAPYVWENEIIVTYKNCTIAIFTTLQSLAEFDLMQIPKTAFI